MDISLEIGYYNDFRDEKGRDLLAREGKLRPSFSRRPDFLTSRQIKPLSADRPGFFVETAAVLY
jgi:hypothetical protein